MKSVAAPVLDKNKQNVLKYVGNETWHLVVGDEVSEGCGICYACVSWLLAP